MPVSPDDVLVFWFEEARPDQHFKKDPAFDRLIVARFADAYDRAARGELDRWRDDAAPCLALVIMLDQFPRNMFRGTPRAFATDAKALAVAEDAIARGHDLAMPPERRLFFYLPLEHCESLDVQERCVALIGERCAHDERLLDYARRHRDVIARFGRFPHRNAVLGRPSTPAEAAFLEQPDSSF